MKDFGNITTHIFERVTYTSTRVMNIDSEQMTMILTIKVYKKLKTKQIFP